MRWRVILMLGVIALSGCNVAVPNGLFGCGQPTDCPSGYFCWNSDSRCYDSKEPGCAPKTCEQVIGDFASLGIPIECGSLPDGCEGFIDCGGCAEGSVCGANGQNFICGCEENTCANFGGGAECGTLPTTCGGDEGPIFCGTCFGEQVCRDNQCVCPDGVNCDSGCDGGEPTYPCTFNECSPPGGLPDGCGGVAHCPSCSNEEDCVLSDDTVYECLGDCTCEAEGFECGSTSICGSPTLCGTCADNGFEGGYRCETGRCVCEDIYEDNDTFSTSALVCGEGSGPNCAQDVWGIEIEATLHGPEDIDYYVLRVLDAPTPIFAQAYGGKSQRVIQMTYLCPDGFEGMEDCTGSTDSIQGIKFCVDDRDTIGIQRRCEQSGVSELGTVLIGVQAKDFEGDCDSYGLNVFATYGIEVPVSF